MVAVARGAEKYTLHTFQKIQLSDQFFGEGANFGDFNHDGVMDIVSGPYWYAGPKFTERHAYYEAKPFDIANYSENFFAFTYDVNRDGWTDIVIVGFPGKEAWWFANPQGKAGAWERHVMLATVDDESPTFTDITGDGVPDLVCASGGQLGYAEIPKDDPKQPWKFHPVTPEARLSAVYTRVGCRRRKRRRPDGPVGKRRLVGAAGGRFSSRILEFPPGEVFRGWRLADVRLRCEWRRP